LLTISEAAARQKISFEILVFDDNSKDSTVAEVKKFSKDFPEVQLTLVENKARRGLARNYIDGAYIATGEHYMLVNGDNAEPVETLEAILSMRGQADIIIPVFKGNDRRTAFRRVLSNTFTNLVNLVSGFSIGYYNGPALHRRFNVVRWHADTDGFAYQAEIITRLLQEGATYKEVSVRNTDRILGASSAVNHKNFLAVAHSLLQIWMRRLRYSWYYKGRTI
jgi:glycosyltransferase involved in cell wall biosynthesis